MKHYQQFLDSLDNDLDMVNIILSMYKEEHSDDIEKIKSYYNNKDLDGLFHVTHSLKGVISNFFEEEICDLLEQIETKSKTGDTPDETLILSACEEINKLNSDINSRINA
ncbi:Hpt domain-containing protein [uncultured Shewanella sp.]|uniref:Hpt domain-containing protein n=1 Tax=uncultured Shewanella sp. TaxID=173975 RepID=UPI002622E7F4|nr:Hpt domain-containing protein [uncultured Shewanella sp.]